MNNIILIFSFSFLLINSCNSQNPMDVQGHRGCRGLLPENTLEAFEKAIDLGVTTLELDVVISQDNRVVVSHDPYMHHDICTGLDGHEITQENEKSFNLYEMTYDSIRKYDCGLKGNSRFPEQVAMKAHKPLLSEVIEMAEEKSAGTIRYNIELKSNQAWDHTFTPDIETFVALVVDEISKFPLENRFNLQSFDLRALEEIHRKYPDIPLALLVEGDQDINALLQKLTFEPEIISPAYPLLDQETVNELHQKGYKVIPWTVNEETEMKKMIDLKVDGIITDYPHLLQKILGN
ncbi:glycerophosphoryl diester phosphodiesterase [Flavobacteriaceae bacterium MAR_2010_188]|nr:glycerophosphoryl diester phosphodiesterase [Flavobacteriaceae bacterium MAR_2010_188]